MRTLLHRAGCLIVLLVAGVTPALANSCPGNANAMGTSRVIVVSPDEFPKVGGQQYGKNGLLALNDREIVLTFDDGPLPPYTTSVLQTLASECVKATFFMVGRQADAHPDLARQVYDAGHVVGTHTHNHPLTFNQMPIARAQMEFNDGLSAVTTALGPSRPIAPYFRIPGLLRSKPIEDYLLSRRIAVWSVDFDADDWKEITPEEIVKRALERIEVKRRGVLLLHDVQPATAQALPALLQELKARGYRIVHAVPTRNWNTRIAPVAAPAPPRLNSGNGGYGNTTSGSSYPGNSYPGDYRRSYTPPPSYSRQPPRAPAYDRRYRESYYDYR